jgi:probable rRNA maturation factor
VRSGFPTAAGISGQYSYNPEGRNTVEIDVRNKCKSNIITTHRLKKITNNVLKLVLDEKGRSSAEVSIVFVDDAEMKNLNKNFRRINKPTDVLAFPMNEGKFATINPELLGDIVISVQTANKQADFHDHSLERELTILLIHGLLHLLGYDHNTDSEEAEMKEFEQEYLMLVEEELSIA